MRATNVTGKEDNMRTNYMMTVDDVMNELGVKRSKAYSILKQLNEELVKDGYMAVRGKKVAELWFRIGWRDIIVPIDEIKCSGCSSHKQCTYHLVECTKENNVVKCNQCTLFPCHKINDMLRRSNEYEKKCREVCTDEEYHMLKASFFNKEQNLQK